MQRRDYPTELRKKMVETIAAIESLSIDQLGEMKMRKDLQDQLRRTRKEKLSEPKHNEQVQAVIDSINECFTIIDGYFDATAKAKNEKEVLVYSTEEIMTFMVNAIKSGKDELEKFADSVTYDVISKLEAISNQLGNTSVTCLRIVTFVSAILTVRNEIKLQNDKDKIANAITALDENNKKIDKLINDSATVHKYKSDLRNTLLEILNAINRLTIKDIGRLKYLQEINASAKEIELYKNQNPRLKIIISKLRESGNLLHQILDIKLHENDSVSASKDVVQQVYGADHTLPLWTESMAYNVDKISVDTISMASALYDLIVKDDQSPHLITNFLGVMIVVRDEITFKKDETQIAAGKKEQDANDKRINQKIEVVKHHCRVDDYLEYLKRECIIYSNHLYKILRDYPLTKNIETIDEDGMITDSYLNGIMEMKNVPTSIKLALQKYKAVDEMYKILDRPKKSKQNVLSDLKNVYNQNKVLLNTRRDNPAITFLKILGTIFSLGIAASTLWEVKGGALAGKIGSLFSTNSQMGKHRKSEQVHEQARVGKAPNK